MESADQFGYFVDQEKAEEAERLRTQGRFLDKCMGLFPSNIEMSIRNNAKILDVGCASGGWASAMVAKYRHIHVTGIDNSVNMIRAAKARAIADNLQDETFLLMDATKPLDFADASFDIIHARLLFAFQTRDTWPLFLKECARLLKPGGYLISTENDAQSWTTSPALAKFYILGHQAIFKHQNSFREEYAGVVVELPRLLNSAGLKISVEEVFKINIGQRNPEGYKIGTKDHLSLFRDLMPYYISLGIAAQEELDALYQQMVLEHQNEDFDAYWIYHRIVSQKAHEV